jgi:Cu2+-containing amine oxidase
MMYEEQEIMWQLKRKELQQTIELLKKEMQTLREELSMFQKVKCEKQNTPSKDQVTEYHTDEEELSRETKWILKKNKKRKINASPEMSQQ